MQVGDYQVEYAKSNRSTCTITKKSIPKGALRIAVLIQAKKFDGTQPVWHAWTAFKKDTKKSQEFKKKSRPVWGIENLKPSDQKELQEFMGGSSGTASSSSADGGSEGNQDPKYKAYMEESEMIWKVKDQLKKEDLRSLKEMLEFNDQPTKGGESKIIDRSTFGLLFGKLPTCGQDGCEGGHLSYFNGRYKCSGKTEWGNCSYSASVDKLNLEEWEMPDIDWETNYMNNYEFKKHQKCDYVPNRQVAEPSQTGGEEEEKKEVEEIKFSEEDLQKPLGGYTIAFSGKLSTTHTELKDLIQENGARFSSSVDNTVDFLIASPNEYAKDTGKIKGAKKIGIPIMDEDFIQQSAEQERKFSEEERQVFCLFKPEGRKQIVKRGLEHEEGGEVAEDERPNKKARKIRIKGRAAVHEEVENGDELHVYDEGGDKFNIWSVNLNKVDIQKNRNSYYIIQLLAHDHKKKYYVFRKWGRVGDDRIGGQLLNEYESDLGDAKYQFETLYEKQTGVEWEDRREFRKQPGKMFPVEVDYADDADKGPAGLLSDEQQAVEYKGSLDPRTRELIRLIFDVKQFDQTLKQMEIDTTKMPLGKLSKKNLMEGFSALNELSQLLSSVQQIEQEQKQKEAQEQVEKEKREEEERNIKKEEQEASASAEQEEDATMGDEGTATNTEAIKTEQAKDGEKEKDRASQVSQPSQPSQSSQQPPVEVQKIPELARKAPYRQKFLELSNKFYTIVPHVFGPEGITVIDNEQILKEKLEMVETLLEMEVATTLVDVESNPEANPIDNHYKALKTSLQPLNKDQDEYTMVNTYLQNTHASTHRAYSLQLMDVFAVDREGEQEKFEQWNDVGNRMLLWHGSRITNWTGILSQGLRIAPPEAPATGYMFGKGVYFANMSSKSANYCFTTRENNVGILILSEVVLGDMYERLGAEFVTPEQLQNMKPCKQSTWGKGRTTPNPASTILIDSCSQKVKEKVVVPLGEGVNAPVRGSSLLYDEMIVYDISQIKIRYLLKVRFDYK